MGFCRSIRWLIAALPVLLFAPVAHAADSVWARHADAARAALTRSVEAGYVTPADQTRYLGILAHARVVAGRVAPLRAELLGNVLGQVAAPSSPTAPRALQLYTTLEENVDYFAANAIPADGTDITASDGTVYRFFSGEGLEFHPLADASALNALVAAGDTRGAATLADALAARAVPQPDGSVVWEYRFDFGGERAPWTSGMAQAVLAQALARAGRLDLARRAYDAIPGALDRKVAAGTWIRLYSGSSLTVLNAQLQSAISVADYAKLAGDDAAAAYADRLLATAKAMLRDFDTGHWSRYSLGVLSDLHYQDFVIQLLKQLSTRTGDVFWTDAAARFAQYETEPPLMTGTSVTRVLFPLPEDGVRDDLVVRFFLSKPAKVALVVDGQAVDGYRWNGGWHTFRWTRPTLSLGDHVVRLVASDPAGNAGSTDLGTFAVQRDRTPPTLAASKSGARVFWRAKDDDSGCCRIRVILRGAHGPRLLEPSRRNGSATIPAGYWSVTVTARDAAGNVSQQPLGLVIGRGR
jgi:hypothetical protein